MFGVRRTAVGQAFVLVHTLNTLTVNAMTTADTVLVPIQCEYYALEGLSQLIHTIELVKKRLNVTVKEVF